jgi:hypothetical protein
VRELVGVGLPVRILVGELALAEGFEELDIVRLECAQLVGGATAFFPFTLLCSLRDIYQMNR